MIVRSFNEEKNFKVANSRVKFLVSEKEILPTGINIFTNVFNIPFNKIIEINRFSKSFAIHKVANIQFAKNKRKKSLRMLFFFYIFLFVFFFSDTSLAMLSQKYRLLD